MSIITIDLGTTNTKVTAFSRNMAILFSDSRTVDYVKDGDFVEFDASDYLNGISDMLAAAANAAGSDKPEEINITGQAETLVVLDKNLKPLLPIISWLDKRSVRECHELKDVFGKECYGITGQPEFIPTWPATKILWIKRNRPDVFAAAHKYVLLQDYVGWFLTGRFTVDTSIAGFTCYFDINKKTWWKKILDYIGIDVSQLPEIVEPNTIVGTVTREIPGIGKNTRVNSGLLDHFAGMIGTGNIEKGVVSESAGTVLSLATFVDSPIPNSGIPTYCGPFKDTYVLLPVCESGGICLQWFRDSFMKGTSFSQIDELAGKINGKTDHTRIPIFLPYIAGTNSPGFDETARGVFFGLTNSTTPEECALSVMQGVACMLRENMEFLENSGIPVSSIISTGGGAKSKLWTQIKSDFTERKIVVPENEETPSLGAGLLSAVNCGIFSSIREAIDATVILSASFTPENPEPAKRIYTLYRTVYTSLRPAFALYTAQ